MAESEPRPGSGGDALMRVRRFFATYGKQKIFPAIAAELDLGRTASARFVLAYVAGSALRTPPP